MTARAGAPKPAKPTKSIFDPFNSSATGHQRADNRLSGSTSWRDSRSLKLRQQFSAGTSGGKRVSDTVGAGSLDFGQDGRTESGGWVPGASGLRKGGQQSIWESMPVDKPVERPSKKPKLEEEQATTLVNPFTPFRKENGTVRETSWTSHESSPSHLLEPIGQISQNAGTPAHLPKDDASEGPKQKQLPQVFANLTIYINGSTAPFISDHKLKQLLSSNGANMSIALGRRMVTHVIVGKPVGSGGCGGGLSGSKLQKEIARTHGKGLKFVTAEWAVDSVKAGTRLPESRYQAMKLGGKGVSSVASLFDRQKGKEAKGGMG